MILNALRLMVEAIEAFRLEDRDRFCSRTRKTVNMATSVLPCRKPDSAGDQGRKPTCLRRQWELSSIGMLATVMCDVISITLPQTNIFSFERKAVGNTMDWILFNVV